MSVYDGQSAAFAEGLGSRFGERTSSAHTALVFDHRGLAALVFLHAASVLWIGRHFNITYDPSFRSRLDLFELLAPAMIVAIVVARFTAMVVVHRPPRPVGWMGRDLSYSGLNGVCGVGLIGLFISNFSDLKSAIPSINPFSWDRDFAAAGRILHFGHHAWEWILIIPGIEHLLPFLSFCYNFWVVVVFATLIAVAFSNGNHRLRLTFLYAFVLTWAIGGNLLATIFSSAGPVYLQRLGGSDEYQPLVAYLGAHAEGSTGFVRAVQELLWQQYVGHASRLGGISAMPSLHVATAVLLALFGFQLHRVLGWLFSMYAVIIMVGSIVLGWHYAVDGYAGIVIALLCWWGASWLSRPESWFGPVSSRA